MNAADPFEDYYYLGRITKLHGFDGKVAAFLDTDEPELYRELRMVFLKIGHAPVPYFIQDIKIRNNKANIRFQDIDDADAAEVLVNKELYLPLSELPELSGNKFYYHEVKGFRLIDQKYGSVGIVQQVLDYPNQSVFQVIQEKKEILIPVSEAIVKKVDREKQEIYVKAPEGLIQIYL